MCRLWYLIILLCAVKGKAFTRASISPLESLQRCALVRKIRRYTSTVASQEPRGCAKRSISVSTLLVSKLVSTSYFTNLRPATVVYHSSKKYIRSIFGYSNFIAWKCSLGHAVTHVSR